MIRKVDTGFPKGTCSNKTQSGMTIRRKVITLYGISISRRAVDINQAAAGHFSCFGSDAQTSGTGASIPISFRASAKPALIWEGSPQNVTLDPAPAGPAEPGSGSRALGLTGGD